MFVKRIAAVLVLACGGVGVAACGAGGYGVWLAWSRLDRVNDAVFDAADRGLGRIEDRVPAVQQRVRDATVTTAEVAGAVRAWGAEKVRDRAVARLEIEGRVEVLSGHLRAADLRLEASAEAVGDVRRVLELGRSLGARVDPAATDGVLELLAAARDAVRQAGEAVDRVRGFTTPGPGESAADRLARVAELLARVLLTLGEVDRRLDAVAARLSEARTDARELQGRTGRYLAWGAAVCYGLLAWIAAGQAALCSWGWSRCRRGRPQATTGPDRDLTSSPI
jgi:hypothetical protein